MGLMQAQTVEKDLYVHLSDNPFVPPQGNVCFINNLPPELLSRIFEVGAANYDSDDEDDSDDLEDADTGDDEGTDDDGDDDESDATGSSDFLSPGPPFQIVVSHVCHHWRNVALSTPSLWTTIEVTPQARPPYQPVSMLLERSKGLPIDIYIDCELHDHDHDHECSMAPTADCTPSDADLRFLCQLLTPHVHRWRTIDVSVSDYHHMFVFLSAISHPDISAAPQLTTLQLYHHEETEEFDTFEYPSMSKHFILFGGSAPSLTSVVLWGVHVDWDQPWITSASKLTELELAYHAEDVRPSWAQLAAILRGATSLEKLNLCTSGPSGDPPEWTIEPTTASPRDLDAPVQLPKVIDFVLAFHSQARAIGLLRKLVLPAVKHLVLDFDNGDYTELVYALVSPATSLSPPSAKEEPRSLLSSLESLKLAGLPCSTECVETFYGELQNLTSLNISLSYLPEEFIELLCSSRTLLPRLVTLYVSGTSADVLQDVVESRKCAGMPLESLYVDESCGLGKRDVEWFKQNVKTFERFEGSDDEDVIEFEDSHEDVDEWSDMD